MTSDDHKKFHSDDREIWGILAEFEDVDGICRGTKVLRQAKFTHFEVHSPFPIHWEIRALPPTKLPWIVLVGGLTGMFAGLFLTWYASATQFDLIPAYFQGYPFAISGKPFWSLPAFIPVIFELTVLFSAVSAVLGMIGLNRLPQLHHPLFASEAFRRVTQDRFFISVEATDPEFDHYLLDEMLRVNGATTVERINCT